MTERSDRSRRHRAPGPGRRPASASSLGSNAHANTGNFFITLKPRERRPQAQRRPRSSPACGRKLAAVAGHHPVMQAAQDINVGGRIARTQYQYTLTDANIAELNEWAPRILERLRQLPSSPTWRPTSRPTRRAAQPHYRSRPRRELRHHARDDRRHDLRRDRAAPGHAVLHPAQRLPRDHRGDARAAARPDAARQLYLTSPTTGKQVPLSTFVKIDNSKTDYLSISHQGQFPAVTISFNLAPGVALGQAVDAIKRRGASIGSAGHGHRRLSGHRAGVPALAA